mgnify:CR=1 FL=1|tara:strand:+ start:2237 stop:2695 length:459 start_codon:yes stop_codon:yes gene_type:complete
MTICSICTEEYGDNSYTIPECSHTFCTNCIVRWFREGHSSCPNCRGDYVSDALNWIDSLARGKELRRLSRKKNAPARLKKLVEDLKKAEQKLRESTKQNMEFRREHAEVFKTNTKQRNQIYKLRRNVRQCQRTVGCFACPELPVPNIQPYWQ